VTISKTLNLPRIAQRYATFAGTRIALVLGRWLVIVSAIHRLGDKEFARMAAALSAAEILRAMADAGVESFVYARLGPRNRRLAVPVRAALLLRLSAGLFLCLAAWVSYSLLAGPSVLLIIFLLIPIAVIQYTAFALLQKERALEGIAGLIVSTLAVSLGVGLIANLSRPNLSWTVLLLLIPDVSAALVACWLARAPLMAALPRRRRQWRLFGRALARIRWVLGQNAVVSILVMSYSRLDVLVVLPLCGWAAQGVFSSAFRLVEPAFRVLGIAANALLAELGGGTAQQSRQLGRLAHGGRAPVFWTALALSSVLLASSAQFLTERLFKLNDSAALVAGIWVAAMPFRLANSFTSAILQRLGGFGAVMKASSINAALIFSSAVPLTLQFGAVGTACAVVIGEAANAALQRRALQQRVASEAQVQEKL
jgi:O-antigen/teichoic acid export membrane protein